MNLIRSTVLVVFVLAGCSHEGTVSPPDDDELNRVDKVIGVRFVIPGEKPENTVGYGFSLLEGDGEVNISDLERIGVKTAELNREQISKLISAVYEYDKPIPGALCYRPHHIFLFYDEDDELVNSVEVCFECTQIRTSPPIDETGLLGYDFKTLALLCDEIGIGLTEGPFTSADFVKWWEKEFED